MTDILTDAELAKKYRLGHPNPPDPVRLAQKAPGRLHPQIASRLSAHLDGSQPLPPSADKLPAWTRCDQGPTSSCTWASFSVCLEVACISFGIPLGFIPSQREGYSCTRRFEIDAATPADAVFMDPLEDGGANIEDVYSVAEEIGVVPMLQSSTADGRFYDIDSDNVNDEPIFDDVEDAQANRIKLSAAQHVILPSDPHRSDLMAAALDASPPVPLHAAGLVDNDFMRLGPGDVAQAPKANNGGGGHAFCYSKYRTVNGQRQFFLENSWGPDWADNGGVWCSEAQVASLWAIYPLYPVKVAVAS